MNADTVVAYTFQADIYCPPCTLALVKATYPLDYPLVHTLTDQDGPEDILGTVAKSLNLSPDVEFDRYDERSFDSGDFPKVVFADSVQDYDESEFGPERCGSCGETIL